VNGLELALSSPNEIRDNPFMPFTVEVPLAELISRSRAGDAGAMEEIYARYKTALFNLAYRHTYNRAEAEDLLQDVFIKIFTHLDSVRTADTFTAWAYRIALNTCYSYLRGRRPGLEKTVSLEDVEGVLHKEEAGDKDADLRKPLDEAVAGLPPRLREIFLLHDVEGFKHQEIARMLRLSVGTSKSQLFKARLRIRAFLKRRGIS
jgi:RNA polymerase sigma-70 factor (ECF subfamily)